MYYQSETVSITVPHMIARLGRENAAGHWMFVDLAIQQNDEQLIIVLPNDAKLIIDIHDSGRIVANLYAAPDAKQPLCTAPQLTEPNLGLAHTIPF